VGSDGSVGSTSPDAGVDVNIGLCANDRPGFEGSTLSAGVNVATFGTEEGIVVSAN
jgi:hypothetical protein